MRPVLFPLSYTDPRAHRLPRRIRLHQHLQDLDPPQRKVISTRDDIFDETTFFDGKRTDLTAELIDELDTLIERIKLLSYPTRYPICALGSSLFNLFLLSWASDVIAYAQHP